MVGSRASLYVLDPATGTRTRRGADIEGHIEGGIQRDNPGSRLGVGQLLLTDGDRDAVVPVQTGGEIALVRVALDGDESHTVVADGPRVCTPVAARGQKLLFGAFGFTEPGDLYLADLETGEEQRLTRLNDDVLSELALPTVVPLSFSSIDGAPVEGWFLQPAGAETAAADAPQHPRRSPRRLGRPLQLRQSDVRRCRLRRAARQPPRVDRVRRRLRHRDQGRLGQPRLRRPDGGRRLRDRARSWPTRTGSASSASRAAAT